MDYLPHAAQVLYMRVLRRRMDYATGVVGITARLSYQLIAEWMEVRPPVKSTKPLVRMTKGEIRYALEQLERAGLILRMVDGSGDVLPLVFSMPLARTGLLRKKYEQQDEQHQKSISATPKSDSHNTLVNSLFSSINSNSSAAKMPVDKSIKNSQKTGMSNTKNQYEQQDEQHTSGMSCLSLSQTNNLLREASDSGSLCPDDWLPGEATVSKLGYEFGLPKGFIKRKALELKIYWQEQGLTAMDWDRYFYGACKNKIAERDMEFLSAQIKLAAGGGHE
jgi:hypothetical protein